MSDGLKEAIEIIVTAVIAIVLVAASAFVTHRMDAGQLQKVKATYAIQQSTENQALLKQYADAVSQRNALQATVNQNAADAATKIQKGQDDLQNLNDCIAAGKCGLHVTVKRASCSAPTIASGGMPATASDSTSTSAELDGQAQQAYSDLRGAIVQVQGQLEACQDFARSVQAAGQVQSGKVTQ